MKVIKKCMNHAAEESYEIYSGDSKLVTSAPFSNNEERADEYCLTSNTNNQFVLTLKDSYGDSWTTGTWVRVEGAYGNILLKTMMKENREESYPLSLYYPVLKSSEWKMYSSASSVPENWSSLAFSDDWQQVALGTAIPSVAGTQYFRKTFTGLASMAAYEIELNYRYGVIAYINGNEIFRDNMEALPPTASSLSFGSYDAYAFRGVIRSAGDVSASSNVLAVELHFPALDEHAVDFDAYIAAIAPSTVVGSEDLCYTYAYPVTVEGAESNPMNVIDFKMSTKYITYDLPDSLTYALGGPRAVINGVRVFSGTLYNSSPADFVWEGSMDSASWSSVFTVTGATYAYKEIKVFKGVFGADAFKSYRLTISEGTTGDAVDLFEVHPVTCSVQALTTIPFDPSSYSFYANYDEILIEPSLKEFSGCTVAPALPEGLTINPSTCAVSGRASTALANTTFTVTATVSGSPISGSFSLEIVECAGSLVSVVRTYSWNAFQESFSIKDMATQQVVLEVAANSGQVNSVVWSTLLCLSGAKYEIDIGSIAVYWQTSSFLYVRSLLNSNEYDTVVRMRYDSHLGLAEDAIVNVQWSVAPQSQWFYKMGEVPGNWFGPETAGWSTGSMGGFSGATNQIQLYKKTFSVGSLNNVAGFVISLRYLYGCVIYLNGVEAFRNGVEGEVSASSVGLNAYSDLMYRQISLPVKTMGSTNTPAVNYLQEGSNTIAIAIVAQTASQTTSYFDCALRLMGDVANSRVFDYTASSDNISGSPSSVAELYYGYTIYSSTCGANHWTLSFKNDRREWLSYITLYLYYSQNSQQPVQFLLKARNANIEDWTLIKNVTGMTWSLKGEHKRIWLENSKPYNQYRLENIASGNFNDCMWKLSAIDLGCSSTVASIPDLSYPSPIVLSRGVEMGEVYANSDYYYDFTVSPALPTGVSLDFNTGKISGRVTSLVPSAVYQITAKKYGGGSSTASITLSVEACTGTKSLITLVVQTDSWPEEGSFKLFSGKGTSGEVVASVPEFKVKNGLNYGDFCVANNIYTLVVYDLKKNGWSNPAGWYLTIDVGEMVFEMGQMPVGVASVSTMFSSLLPFQIEYDEWKVWNKEEAVSGDWKSVEFDDAAWETKKAAEFGNHVGTTAYVRREVTIPLIEDYHVLNVRMKYAGGVVAYMNGVKVARFNLEENYDASSEALMVHDASLFSKFHVVLSTVGAVSGKNMISFEIHRAPGESGVVFDATGVFGVNDCSIVVDSYSSVDGTDVVGCTKEELLDLNPTTFATLSNVAGSFLSWTVDNLEGSKFNSFGMLTNTVGRGYGFSVYSRWNPIEDYTSALAVTEQTTKDRDRSAWSMPVGIAGFRDFKFEVDSPASDDVSVNSFITQYCKPSGSGSCPGIDDYPGVGEGEISPSKCPEGFRGYSYRECVNGVLGEVKSDKCEYKLPANLNYLKNSMEFVVNTEVSSGVPSFDNLVTEFFMQDSTPLPEGLTLNPTTGEITGVPKKEAEQNTYVVRAKNPAGETLVEVTISIRLGRCPPEGVFETTLVGETAVYPCSMQGSYVGSQKRVCSLGKKDGEWQQATGFCMPIFAIVALVVVAILIIAIIVFLVMRTSRKAKAVGGVKGKAAVKKMETKKTVTKAVKV